MIGNFPVPGARCWANFCGSYGLPDGLPGRSPLQVVEWNGFTGIVRDDAGNAWELNRVQIDTGFTFHLDGLECPEHSPKAVEYLRHVVKSLGAKLASLPASVTVSERVDRLRIEEKLSRARWYLERNGHDPDTLPTGRCPRIAGGTAPLPLPNPRLPVRPETPEPRRMRS